jgi:hypothetical protein
MSKYLALILAFSLHGFSALSAETCDAPVADWQPRQNLRVKLEEQGWHIRSIIARDGCYVAIAVDSTGNPVSASFNPKTLLPRTVNLESQKQRPIGTDK